FAPFDPGKGLAARDDRPPADVEKVRDERLDVVHRPLPARRRRQRMIRLDVPGRHAVHALVDDPQTLAHLLDAYLGTRVTVAGRRRRHIELELLESRIRTNLAKIPLEA